MGKYVKILVVDDEANVVESLKIILKDEYKIITAYNGPEALKKASKEKPDIILLDIRLPGMDGLEVLRKLQGFPLDVIIVSVVKDMKTVFRAMELGAYDYITKPFDVDGILLRVKRTVEKQILERENAYLKKQIKAKMLSEGYLQKGLSYRQTREQFERKYFKEVLESTNWNQRKASRLLKIHRNTLMNKIRELGIRKRN